MTKYLISFPAKAMDDLSAEELARASVESHRVIEEAKAAGIYVFAGGLNSEVAPVRVSSDGSASSEIYPGSGLDGGFCIIELPTREEAQDWAARIAAACRCSQELREFMYDPAS